MHQVWHLTCKLVVVVVVVRVPLCNEMSTAGLLSHGSSPCYDRIHDGLLFGGVPFSGCAQSLTDVPLYHGDDPIFDDAPIPQNDVFEALDGTSQGVGAASSELS